MPLKMQIWLVPFMHTWAIFTVAISDIVSIRGWSIFKPWIDRYVCCFWKTKLASAIIFSVDNSGAIIISIPNRILTFLSSVDNLFIIYLCICYHIAMHTLYLSCQRQRNVPSSGPKPHTGNSQIDTNKNNFFTCSHTVRLLYLTLLCADTLTTELVDLVSVSWDLIFQLHAPVFLLKTQSVIFCQKILYLPRFLKSGI